MFLFHMPKCVDIAITDHGAVQAFPEANHAKIKNPDFKVIYGVEGYLVDGTLKTDTVNLATIAIACAVGYLNFRRVAPGWCVDRPHLVKLVENLFSRESFARTEPPKA